MQGLISKQWNFPQKKTRKLFLILWKYTQTKKKNQYSQTIRPKLIWHQKIKTELQGETNKNHSNKFFLLISINHSKNFNAKIYNSSLSARCLQGYARELQVKKGTFVHNLFFFFLVDNLTNLIQNQNHIEEPWLERVCWII